MSHNGVCLLLLVVVALSSVQWVNSGKYDYVNPKALMRDRKKLTEHIQCLLGNAQCTPDGWDFKEFFPKALKDGCAACNRHEKAFVKVIAMHLARARPTDWNKILDKIDPEKMSREKIKKLVG